MLYHVILFIKSLMKRNVLQCSSLYSSAAVNCEKNVGKGINVGFHSMGGENETAGSEQNQPAI